MKLYSLICLLILSNLSYAQLGVSNCSSTAAQVVCPSDLNLCFNETSNPIQVSVASSLPNLEYVVADESVVSTTNTGASIIDFDVDGIITPSDYLINPPTQLTVTPTSYDLPVIQGLADDILTGVFIIFPCCTFVPDICAALNSNGIYSGADVVSLEQLLPILSSSGQLLSIQDVTNAVDSVNLALSDPSIPAACGGGIEICYAFGNSCTFDVIADDLIFTNADHQSSTIETAGNSIISTAVVSNNLNVAYEAAQIICLDNDFTVDPSGEFSAIILPCQ